ncbi:MAG: hypothetical protein PHO93_02525 [Candidatus Saccharimonadaceae bacterium]|nr:hypothetical protein [Candidatus Saccharimonadaceae bacterium]
MSKSNSLSARELLKNVFEELTKEGGSIKLPFTACAEIARDWDRSGHTLYHPESVKLLKIGDKEWIVAYGEATMGYVSERFNCDIAVIRYDSTGKSESEIAKEAYDLLERNYFFDCSPVYAMANGQLYFCKYNDFAGIIRDKLTETGNCFVARNAELSGEKILLGTGQPVVLFSTRYKAELADFLCNTLCELLQ